MTDVERPLKRKSPPPATTEDGKTNALASSSTQPSSAAATAASRRRTRFIQAGDLVILFMSRDRPMITMKVTPGQHYINSYGSFAHSALVGRPFGSTIRSSNNKGFLTLLRPTPELWTLSLPHRTQILYAPDMSFIALKLGLTPGAKIVEAGTGSGSFTHFLARTVGRLRSEGEVAGPAGRGWKGQDGMGVSLPKGKGVQTRPPKDKSEEAAAGASNGGTPQPANSEDASATLQSRITAAKAAAAPTPDYDGEADTYDGKVWTFEFHRERAARAREEFVLHNLIPLVSSSHRNVCTSGFPSSIDAQADAVFLDLPAPWEAIPFVPSVLNPSHTTRICCFSPCIEQVLRTVKALYEHGFKDVEMYESLVRTHESIRPAVMEMPLKSIDAVQDRLKGVLAKKQKISAWQKMKTQERRDKAAAEGSIVQGEGDDKMDEGGEADVAPEVVEGEGAAAAASTASKQKDAAKPTTPATTEFSTPPQPDIIPLGPTSHKNTSYMIRSNTYSRSHPQMRGHTSYLTFATLLPRSIAKSE